MVKGDWLHSKIQLLVVDIKECRKTSGQKGTGKKKILPIADSLNKRVYFYDSGNCVILLCLKKFGKKQTPTHIATAFVFCYYLIGIMTMTGIVPLVFFVPLLYKKYRHISNIALIGFLFSLSIEIVQMFGRGTTDINDLITNTVGAGLGYFVYKLLSKLLRENVYRKFPTNNINDEFEILFFITCSFVIMVTVQPWVISSLFNLG